MSIPPYTIGIVGNNWPRTQGAIDRTVQTLNGLSPVSVLLLDWWQDPTGFVDPVRDQGPWWLYQMRHQADECVCPLADWFRWRRTYIDYDYENFNEKGTLKSGVTDLPPKWWGKQSLLERSIELGADRMLLIGPGEWLMSPSKALEVFEAALAKDDDLVLSYPRWIVGADMDGDAYPDGRGCARPAMLTLETVENTNPPPGDVYWVALDRFKDQDPGRVCGYAGDQRAFLIRVLATGDGVGVPGMGYLFADLPQESKKPVPLVKNDITALSNTKLRAQLQTLRAGRKAKRRSRFRE